MNTTTRLCTCRDPYQDKKHGRGLRVHNRTKQNKGEAERRWRCTKCGNVT